MLRASMPKACTLWLCMLCALCVTACAHPRAQADSVARSGATQGAGTPSARENDGGVRSVVLPRPLKTGETLILEVELGPTGSGMQIVLRTLDGRLIGTVSPHGMRHGRAGGTYAVPVPEHALQDLAGRVRWPLLVRVESSAAPPQPADTQTVRAIRAVIAPH